MLTATDTVIVDHYQKEAEKHGASPSSTMEDETIRQKELDLIQNFLRSVGNKGKRQSPLKVLDLGCGNGYALSTLIDSQPANKYWGLDFSKQLLGIAQGRKLPNCEFLYGDARSLPFDAGFFDVIYTERCLINILDWEGQEKALAEIHRVLRRDGYYLMIECFTDGLMNNNNARRECGLEELKEAYHNKYFDKKLFEAFLRRKFVTVEPTELDPKDGKRLLCSNFLSSHYFVARVLHPLVTKGANVKNTEFVKFFSFLPPNGNYASIQAYILRKI